MLLERAFEAENPDIDIRWLDLGSQEILDRLRFEKVNPQADVWFGGPTTIFDRGVADSLLTPYRPSWADRVGPDGVGPDDLYFPVYRTPTVIAFNERLVNRAEAPADWDEILEPRWWDQVIIRDPVASGTMRAIWGYIVERSLRETGDTAAAMAWFRRLDGQTRSYTLNPAVLVAKLSRGEGSVTLWDLPDILISRSQGMPFGYVFPRSGSVWSEARPMPTPPAGLSTMWAVKKRCCSRRAGCTGCRPGSICRRIRCRRGLPRWSGTCMSPRWTGRAWPVREVSGWGIGISMCGGRGRKR
jgi:ABC-type Fe3+ transport system substrate-binding protein